MATNGIEAEAVPKTEPVTKSDPEVKNEADTGAGDAPERTPDHAKLLENKLSVEIANKLDDIFKTGSCRISSLSLVAFFFLRHCIVHVTLQEN